MDLLASVGFFCLLRSRWRKHSWKFLHNVYSQMSRLEHGAFAQEKLQSRLQCITDMLRKGNMVKGAMLQGGWFGSWVAEVVLPGHSMCSCIFRSSASVM